MKISETVKFAIHSRLQQAHNVHLHRRGNSANLSKTSYGLTVMSRRTLSMVRPELFIDLAVYKSMFGHFYRSQAYVWKYHSLACVYRSAHRLCKKYVWYIFEGWTRKPHKFSLATFSSSKLHLLFLSYLGPYPMLRCKLKTAKFLLH